MGSINAMNRSLLPDIIDLKSVIPATRDQLILIIWVELNTKDSIGMAREFSLFFHG
jgi:hypothetical protein